MMTREEYISQRGTPSFNLMYEYYKEKFDYVRHSNFLTFTHFVQFMQMWPFAREAYQTTIDYFDEKFEIVSLKDKDDKLIKYL